MANEVTPEQVQRFIERGREFAKTHPDFGAVLQSTAERGLNLSPDHTREIVRLGRPDVVYFLAQKENEAYTKQAVNVAEGEPINSDRAADRIRRLASQLDRNETYKVIESKESDTDAYLRQRKADIRSGKRRR
jgi:hypothetical protein